MTATTIRDAGPETVPTPPGLLAAALILAGRIIGGWRWQKGAVILTWIFPVFVTLIFLGLFGGALKMPDGGSYSDFLMPGMLVVTMLFGLETTTLSAAADAAKGINDRFRSLPVSSTAIVLGRCLADMLGSSIGLAVMVVFGYAIGWRPDATIGAALLALGLLLMLRFALLWLGILIGYRARSVESVAYVQVLVWPVALLSSVFVDPATMPGWLGLVVELNPVSATAGAVRELLGTVTWPGQVVSGTAALALSVVWPLLITGISLPLAALSFRRG